MELVLLIGLPGVGKTTFCERHLTATHTRINLDTLKTRKREVVAVEACIAAGRPLVVDNTNTRVSDRARYIPLAKVAGYRVTGYVFTGPVEEAIKRNAGRTVRAQVPELVIHKMLAEFEPLAWAEGFDALYRVVVSAHTFTVSRVRRRKGVPVPALARPIRSSPERRSSPGRSTSHAAQTRHP